MSNIKLLAGAAVVVVLIVLGFSQATLQNSAQAQRGGEMAPHFEVDPFWPRPLPNMWAMGNTIGVDVDERDHVFVVHRNDESQFGGNTEIGLTGGVAECCQPAPPILEFDPAGNVVNGWGGPDPDAPYVWPASNHGVEVAPNGNVWIGGNGGGDSHVLVFTRDGNYIRTVGIPGELRDSNSETHYGRVAEIAFDVDANEAYFADGYTHRRVAVVDMSTGAFKRYWGAYGNRPDDSTDVTYTPGQPGPQQFRGPVHCAEPSNDGLVYVCDRGADRVQVFRTDGTFVREVVYYPETLNQGSTWDIAFSQDPEQEFIYLADGQNFKISVIDRESMEVLYTFGQGGRQPGTFYAPHSIVTDSEGNIFTTETYEGSRVQKFVYKGMRAITVRDRAPTWPASALD
ncbi:MAG: hypothetical protein ACR2PR_03830 [Pseudohongiellaceae bacterium]